MSFPRRQVCLIGTVHICHTVSVDRNTACFFSDGCENTARHVWGGDYTYIQALTPRNRNASANPRGLCVARCRCNFCRFASGTWSGLRLPSSCQRQTELLRSLLMLHTSFGQSRPRPCAVLHPHPSGMHAPQIPLAFVGYYFSGQLLTLSTSFVH